MLGLDERSFSTQHVVGIEPRGGFGIERQVSFGSVQYARVVEQLHRFDVDHRIGERISYPRSELARMQIPRITEVVRVDPPGQSTDPAKIGKLHPLPTHDRLRPLAMYHRIGDELVGAECNTLIAKITFETKQSFEFLVFVGEGDEPVIGRGDALAGLGRASRCGSGKGAPSRRRGGVGQ
jgi:hypothetical protein